MSRELPQFDNGEQVSRRRLLFLYLLTCSSDNGMIYDAQVYTDHFLRIALRHSFAPRNRRLCAPLFFYLCSIHE